jgi:hypothetical protein
MKPIHKFNNGNGAMICNNCRTIISTGPKTDDLLCEKCSANKRYYVLMEYEPSWMWTKDGDELDWSIVNYNLKEVSPRVEIPEEDIAKEQDKKMYSEEDMMFAYEQGARLALISQSDLARVKGKFPTPREWFDDLKTYKI